MFIFVGITPVYIKPVLTQSIEFRLPFLLQNLAKEIDMLTKIAPSEEKSTAFVAPGTSYLFFTVTSTA